MGNRNVDIMSKNVLYKGNGRNFSSFHELKERNEFFFIKINTIL